ncbi:hypothetical protein GUITHDRAFT_108273 [Guillardia theta CCMP2712]|uniref:Uncharacterized protein n=1 Tax=Guillardia theta (strain CCMP2712) TaxID=905079 RepID=L1JCJ8_GUITC|nr:hypothetical protein GUITHDRAFT_108273 [Guillardia theta CCMP2712]EKX45824.1 hypothetical protein GUITHDRAFT_108273 [Guillardia theta CCMP2712]|eukprot:XP_005832804.1 hypothetical protein GUITHDRAFT_108273 [Guillardia theta CCMP2712]
MPPAPFGATTLAFGGLPPLVFIPTARLNAHLLSSFPCGTITSTQQAVHVNPLSFYFPFAALGWTETSISLVTSSTWLAKTLEVVVLFRDALSILCSCTIKRRFRPWNVQAKTLRTSALDLAAQLRRLDKRSYVCLDYNEIATGKGVEALDELLYDGHAPASGSLGRSIQGALRRPRQAPSPRTCASFVCEAPSEGRRYRMSERHCADAKELHDALEELRRACPNKVEADLTRYGGEGQG